jgi:hypothetical protein
MAIRSLIRQIKSVLAGVHGGGAPGGGAGLGGYSYVIDTARNAFGITGGNMNGYGPNGPGGSVSIDLVAAPEPSTWAMTLTGLAGLLAGASSRRPDARYSRSRSRRPSLSALQSSPPDRDLEATRTFVISLRPQAPRSGGRGRFTGKVTVTLALSRIFKPDVIFRHRIDSLGDFLLY